MVLQKGEELPDHYPNSNVYLIIIRDQMSVSLNEQLPASYSKGCIINIPYKTKMHIHNENEGILEFFVVKAPSPKVMKS